MNRSGLLPLEKFAEPDLRPAAYPLRLTMHPMTSRSPKQETCGHTPQIGRYAACTPDHGAEARSRRSTNGIFQHLPFANGSSHELRYFLMPATDLEYGSRDDIAEPDSDVDRNGAMTVALERPPKKPQAG